MRVLFIFTVSLLCILTRVVWADPLTLQEAVSLIGETDPALIQIEAKAQALDEKAVFDSQLSDPKASVAFQNFPVDNFSRSREGMTQIVVGMSQDFPRGQTLRYKSKRTEATAESVRAHREDVQRTIQQTVRQSWLDVYYWEQAAHMVDHSEVLLKKVLESTKIQYSTGRQNAQNVIEAELELGVLEDQRIDIDRQVAMARAELGKWIGSSPAQRALPKKFPDLPSVLSYEEIENMLVTHPKVKMSDTMIKAGKHDIQIAEEQYKPGFGVGVNYGHRDGQLSDGDNRPDFLTAKVSFDIPLFTGKRQDKNLAAQNYALSAAQSQKDETLRNLKTTLEIEHTNWKHFDKRLQHYNASVVKQAEENFDANLRAYQEDRTDFSSLIRAQVKVLDTKLKEVKLKTEKAKAQARLLYLQGEEA